MSTSWQSLACLAWQGFWLPTSPWAVAGSEAAVAQLGDAWGECLVSGRCHPKYETRLKVGNKFSCPLSHLHKKLGLFEGLQMGAARGWGEQRASAGDPRAAQPFLALQSILVAGCQGCAAAAAGSGQYLMGFASSLSQRHLI